MKIIYLLLFLNWIQNISFANPPRFDQSFKKSYQLIATELAVNDIDKAFRMADSLLNVTSDNEHKMKVLMLIASLNLKQGNISNAIFYALNAEGIATHIKDKYWLVRINGFLSTAYRYAGLYTEGKKYLNKAIAIKSETENPVLLEMLIDQENAFYYLEDGLYVHALTNAGTAQIKYALLPENQMDIVFTATNYYIIASAYTYLDKPDSAYHFFYKGLSTLDTTTNEAKGFLLLGLAQAYSRTGLRDSAGVYFKKAEVLAKSSQNFNLKVDLAKSLMDFYFQGGENSKYNEFKDIYLALSIQQSSNMKKIANEVIRDLNNTQPVPKSKISFNKMSALIGGLALLILVVVLIYLRKSKFNGSKNFLAPHGKLKEKQVNPLLLPIPATPVESIAPAETEDIEVTILDQVTDNVISQNKDPKSKLYEMISEDTVNSILKNLNKFENDKGFLKKELSLTALASKLKTNTKYLSHILNNYKQKDFNQYINGLRIDYLIFTLLHNEVFWEYKIAFWADYSGFSSHSKFTTAFKKITQQTPSEFVQMIRNMNDAEIADLKKSQITNSFD